MKQTMDFEKIRRQAQEAQQKMMQGQQMGQPHFVQKAKKVGTRFAIIGCLVFLLFIGGLLAAIFYFTSVVVEQSSEIDGDTRNYNPIQQYSAVSEIAGEGAKLYEIKAERVKSNGTLDLEAEYKPGPTVAFKFLREVPPPADAPPPGAISSSDGKWYEKITVIASKPGQWFHVKTQSGGMSSEYSYMNMGHQKDVSSPRSGKPGDEIPAPTCSFKIFWDEAIKQGAPENGVSTITYNKDGYEFEIRTSEINLELEFDENCELISEESFTPPRTNPENTSKSEKERLKELLNEEQSARLEEMEALMNEN